MSIELTMAYEIEKFLGYLQVMKSVPPEILASEARLQQSLSNLLGNTFEGVLTELQKRGTIPSDIISQRTVMASIFELEDGFIEAVQRGAVEASALGRQRTIAELQQQGMGISFTEFSQTTRNLIEQHAFEASQRTMQRITGNVMENLTRSYEQGLGIKDAADQLNKVFENIKGYELERIARTEINSFQSMGAHMTEEELGVEYEQWWSAEDERVREGGEADHVEMHGQIVRLGDTFSNGLKYPGDRSGGSATIAEWINCRCRPVPFIMPLGKMAPPGKQSFYEWELIDI